MDLSPSSTEILSNAINARIDAALEAENAAQERRTYLGASQIGEECERRLAYEFHGASGDPFEGRAIRRFRMGQIHEDETARWLRLAGFDLRTHREDGSQWGFDLAPHPETGQPRFAGHTDGVIVGGPDVGLVFPGGWEHKIMKSDIWRAVYKHGVRKENPVYYAQCLIYMRQFGLSWCLFTALNTDTSELLFEVVDYSSPEAEALIEKAARVIESRAPEELPRVAREETDFRCKFCQFRRLCWVSRTTMPNTPAPSWLRKQ